MKNNEIRRQILSTFEQVAAESGGDAQPEPADETVLLSSGLDSLGFAILVARLEEDLGWDPFSISEEAYYPATFGEFVSFYEKHQPKILPATNVK